MPDPGRSFAIPSLRGVALIVAGGLAATSALFTNPAAVDAACSWKAVASQNPPAYDDLFNVSAASATDVWAVGTTASTSGLRATLAEHWNGKAWSVVTTPDPGNGNQLNGVATISATNAWAVGVQGTPSGGSKPLILHWNGKKWAAFAAPAVPGVQAYLNRVAGLAATNLWAVGTGFTNSGGAFTLIEHFDGKHWSVVTSPNPGVYGSQLGGVSGSSVSDVWADGGTFTNPSGTYVTLTEHWDGKTWSVVASPNANNLNNVFNAVVSISPTDAWAVGDYWTGTGSTFDTLTEHWDGKSWKIVASPSFPTSTALWGVTASSANSVWIAGQITSSTGTLIMHWNGKKWARVATPDLPGTNQDYLNSVTTIPGSATLWAVGGDATPSGGPNQTLTADYTCSADAGIAPLGRKRFTF
jgi:hypothetical protein